MARIERRNAVFIGTLLALISCSSDQDDFCDNVGFCAQAGSSDWIEACKSEAQLLEGEANSSGCRGQFDEFYSCADSNFVCNGITPSFPGCEATRAALDQCLAKAEAKTSCADLAQKTANCSAPDAGAGPDSGVLPPAACTLNRDCEAHCYLDSVSNPCGPRVDELSNFSSCASSCPP
jgi:hypothetical protein